MRNIEESKYGRKTLFCFPFRSGSFISLLKFPFGRRRQRRHHQNDHSVSPPRNLRSFSFISNNFRFHAITSFWLKAPEDLRALQARTSAPLHLCTSPSNGIISFEEISKYIFEIIETKRKLPRRLQMESAQTARPGEIDDQESIGSVRLERQKFPPTQCLHCRMGPRCTFDNSHSPPENIPMLFSVWPMRCTRR